MNLLDDDDSDVSTGSPVKMGVDPKIDWFHFETKMRKLIQEMLEPVVKRNAEDSASLKKVENHFEEVKDKQGDIEYRIDRLQEAVRDIPTLEDRINELREDYRQEDQQILYEVSNFKDYVENMKSTNERATVNTRMIESNVEKLSQAVNNIQSEFVKLKEESHSNIVKVSKEMNNALSEYK